LGVDHTNILKSFEESPASLQGKLWIGPFGKQEWMCWLKYLRTILNGAGETKIVCSSIRNFNISEIYILVM